MQSEGKCVICTNAVPAAFVVLGILILLVVSVVADVTAFILALVLMLVTLFFVPITVTNTVRDGLIQKTTLLMDLHVDALIRRRVQLVEDAADDQRHTAEWDKEIAYFLQAQLIPTLSKQEAALLNSDPQPINAMIEQRVRDAMKKQASA